MGKIAFFVEGQTEQIFVTRLVKEILGYENVTLIIKKLSGGTNAPKQESIRGYSIAKNSTYIVLIYDCGSDNRVKSEILENLDNLKTNGYTKIIGIRDLFPLPQEDLPRLKKGLQFLPHSCKGMINPFNILVVVQEVETWFLAETDHFKKVDKRLTGRFIEKKLGFDPYHVNPVSRDHPSQDLNKIYKLVGKSYTKKYWQVDKLVNRLNFGRIRHELRYSLSPLDELIKIIEEFKKQNKKK